jgi:hypothetical protein
MPLALRIAGSVLAVNALWPVGQYLEWLEDHTERLPALEDSRRQVDLDKRDHPNLRAAFDLSYNRLMAEEQKRWRALGVFPASFDARAARAVWDREEAEALNLLDLLRRYSLLDYDETSARCSLHDLLADYARSQMEPGEEVHARVAHAGHYAEVLEAINQMFFKGGENILPALRRYDGEWANIEAGQKASVKYLEESREAARACNLYARQGSINGLRLKPREQIEWIEGGLQAARFLPKALRWATWGWPMRLWARPAKPSNIMNSVLKSPVR